MQTFHESGPVVQTAPASATPGAFCEQVTIPVTQAIAGGVFVGAVAALVVYGFFTEDRAAALRIGAIVGLVTAALLYLLWVSDARALLRVRSEPVATAPMGLPMPTAARERLLLVNPPTPETVAARLREQADQERQSRFAAFIAACENSTARRDLLQSFSETELADYRAALMRLGLAQDRGPDPRAGWELTRPAGEIMARLGLS